jgi:hypothetical protein
MQARGAFLASVEISVGSLKNFMQANQIILGFFTVSLYAAFYGPTDGALHNTINFGCGCGLPSLFLCGEFYVLFMNFLSALYDFSDVIVSSQTKRRQAPFGRLIGLGNRHSLRTTGLRPERI